MLENKTRIENKEMILYYKLKERKLTLKRRSWEREWDHIGGVRAAEFIGFKDYWFVGFVGEDQEKLVVQIGSSNWGA